MFRLRRWHLFGREWIYGVQKLRSWLLSRQCWPNFLREVQGRNIHRRGAEQLLCELFGRPSFGDRWLDFVYKLFGRKIQQGTVHEMF